eukprot:scaffold16082_cov93-Skeletonema_dohrnii-CCMP3373.AAC.1
MPLPASRICFIILSGIRFFPSSIALSGGGDMTNCGPPLASIISIVEPSTLSILPPPIPPDEDPPKNPFINVMALPLFSLPSLSPLVVDDDDCLCQRTCMEERDQAARRAAPSSSFSRHGQRLPNSLSVKSGIPCHAICHYFIAFNAQIPIAAPLFTMVVARALGSFRPRRCSHVISRHAAVRAGVNYSEEKLWLAFASVAAIAMLNVQDDNEDNTIRNRTRCDFNSDYHSSLLHRYSKEKNDKNNQKIMHTKYNIDWSNVLGEGAYGKVYLARVADTGEKVALKKISKRYTNSSAFISETAALWRVFDTGGHPNISGLRDILGSGRRAL